MKRNVRSVQETEHYFTTLLPAIQSERFSLWTIHSFEPIRFSESVHQIRLKRLKHFASWAAQIYKLLKTHFQTLDSQSDSKSSKILMYLILWWMNHSELQFLQQSLNWANSSTRTEDWWCWYEHVWTQHWIEGRNERFYGFSLFSKKMSWWRLVYSLYALDM